MRIAIIGAGNLGSALGRGWRASGHDVTFGVRDTANGNDAVKGAMPAGARVAQPRDAVKGAEVVVLAVPAAVADSVIQDLGDAIDGAVVIDATNPIGPGLRLLTGADGASHAEQMALRLATTAPRARLVKSFNQAGANVIEEIARFPGRPVMFAAGDDAESRNVVAKLAADLGFEPIEAGPLVRARELERLAALWIALSASQNASLGRNFAFSLARLQS